MVTEPGTARVGRARSRAGSGIRGVYPSDCTATAPGAVRPKLLSLLRVIRCEHRTSGGSPDVHHLT